MSAPWNEWDWDYLWHALLGAAINSIDIVPIALLGWPSWMPVPAWSVAFLMVPFITAGGIIREKTQRKDPLTAHQWLEGVLWGAGGLVAALVGLPFLL
jgi:hypothetical protein